jgi:tetratricopeptide (TPR) repeat protein
MRPSHWTAPAAALALAALGALGCAGHHRKTSQYDLALYLKSQGKPDEAEAAMQASVKLDPSDPTPQEALAQMYYDKGWRAQALQEWEQAFADSSDDPAFYVGEDKPKRSPAWIADGIAAHKRAAANLIMVYLAQGDEASKGARWADAAADYKRATELDQDNLAAWSGWAKSAKKLGDADTTYLAYRRCFDLLPKDPDVSRNYGLAAYAQHRLNEAENGFRRYTVLRPDDAKGYNNEGTVLAEMGRFDESQASFDKALQIETNMIQALNGKGTAYYYQKRYDEARKMWAQVLDLAPEDPTATENMRTLVKMGY